MSNLRNYRKYTSNGKTMIKVFPKPQFVKTKDGWKDIDNLYSDVKDMKMDVTVAERAEKDKNSQERREQLYELKNKNKITKLEGEVIVDTEDISDADINVIGRNRNMREAEKKAGINYPRELIWIDGAEEVSGIIKLPYISYDKVYTVEGTMENPKINFINSLEKEKKLQKTDTPERPYYEVKEGQTFIYVDHFSGGSGAQTDPFIIETLQELRDLSERNGMYDWASYYKLGANIDASNTSTWNAGAGFSPIGNSTTAFVGEFDGADYSITNLYINRPSSDYNGLFGYVENGIIKNLTVNGDVTGLNINGIICGIIQNTESLIENCESSGSITGETRTGGLLGYPITGATIRGCVNTASVTGYSTTSNAVIRIGGLCGQVWSDSTISDCKNKGNITIDCNYTAVTDIHVGGFIGRGYYYATIEDCYTEADISIPDNLYGNKIGGFAGHFYQVYVYRCGAKGSINQGKRTGGFIEYNDAIEIINCYANVSINDTSYRVGGFVCEQQTASTISKCYASGVIPSLGSSNEGAFCGYNVTDISDCYYDNERIALTNNGAATALTTTQMKDPSNFTNWDFNTVWFEDSLSKNNEGYHILQGIDYDFGPYYEDLTVNFIQKVDLSATTPGGSGIIGDPYLIESLQDLRDLSERNGEYDWNSYYKLTVDIDAADTSTWNAGAGFSPIGNQTTNFTGNFDGDGHTITNLYINKPIGTNDYTGMFGYVSSGGIIKNLTVNGDVTGYQLCGIIAGRIEDADSLIDNCRTTGQITGTFSVGGLVGAVGWYPANGFASVTNSFSSADVTGIPGEYSDETRRIGGFVGQIWEGGTITNCESIGNIEITEEYSFHYDIRIGGFIGYEYGNDLSPETAIIENCYSNCDMILPNVSFDNVGGFVGEVWGGVIRSCGAVGSINDTQGNYIGGFIGYSVDLILENCYTRVDLGNAVNYIGGFGGSILSSTGVTSLITNCYTASSTLADSNYGTNTGSFIGYFDTGNNLTNCYYDNEVNLLAAGTSGATGLTTSQMKDASNFINWNFGTIWERDIDDINNGYHILQGIEYPTTIVSEDLTIGNINSITIEETFVHSPVNFTEDLTINNINNVEVIDYAPVSYIEDLTVNNINNVSISDSISTTGWLGTWTKRREITVDNTNIDSNLTHFPVLLSIGTAVGQANDDISSIFDEVGANSQKIAITKSDGSTQIYGEVEKWDAVNEEAYIWVSRSDLVINSAEPTTLYIYYDNSQDDNTTYIGSSAVDTPTNNVWDANYVGVWHLNESPSGAAGEIKDSSGNNNDGTTLGTMGSADQIAGQVDGSLDFDGVDDYVNAGNGGAINGLSQLTVGVWVQADAIGVDTTIWRAIGDDSMMLRYDSAGYEYGGSNVIQFDVTATSARARIESSNNLQTTNWQYLTAVWNGTELFLYANGVLDTPTGKYGNSGGTLTGADRNNIADAGDQGAWDGQVDEWRISSINRSPAWIKANYYAQTDNLVAFGVEETTAANQYTETLNIININNVFEIDAIATSETLIAIVVNNISIIDNIAVTETLQAVEVISVSITEAIVLSEPLDVTAITQVLLEDTANITESIQIRAPTQINIIDEAGYTNTINILDITQVALTEVKSIIEELNVTDINNVNFVDEKGNVETLNIDSVYLVTLLENQNFFDALNINNINSINFSDNQYSVDSLNVNNINRTNIADLKIIIEILDVGNINSLDLVDAKASTEPLIVDNINLTSITDYHYLVDALNVVNINNVSLEEYKNSSEILNVNDVIRVYLLDVLTSQAEEILQVQQVNNVTLEDAIKNAYSELLELQQINSVNLEDAVSSFETLNIDLINSVIIADEITGEEEILTVQLINKLNIEDLSRQVDTLNIDLINRLSLQDNLIIAEILETGLILEVTLSDILKWYEELSVQFPVEVTIEQISNLVDNLIINQINSIQAGNILKGVDLLEIYDIIEVELENILNSSHYLEINTEFRVSLEEQLTLIEELTVRIEELITILDILYAVDNLGIDQINLVSIRDSLKELEDILIITQINLVTLLEITPRPLSLIGINELENNLGFNRIKLYNSKNKITIKSKINNLSLVSNGINKVVIIE